MFFPISSHGKFFAYSFCISSRYALTNFQRTNTVIVEEFTLHAKQVTMFVGKRRGKEFNYVPKHHDCKTNYFVCISGL